MQKLYQLEAYHWDKDYWSTVGTFLTKDSALQGKNIIESKNSMVSCSIFEKEIVTDFNQLLVT